MNKLTAVVAAGALALGLAACGDDDGGGGSDSGAKAELLSELTADGTEGIDESCLEDKVNDLSDSDAQFLVDNIDAEDIPDGAPAAAIEFATSLFDCLDFDLDDLDIDLDDIDLGD